MWLRDRKSGKHDLEQNEEIVQQKYHFHHYITILLYSTYTNIWAFYVTFDITIAKERGKESNVCVSTIGKITVHRFTQSC